MGLRPLLEAPSQIGGCAAPLQVVDIVKVAGVAVDPDMGGEFCADPDPEFKRGAGDVGGDHVRTTEHSVAMLPSNRGVAPANTLYGCDAFAACAERMQGLVASESSSHLKTCEERARQVTECQ